jgi:hypothetical protein
MAIAMATGPSSSRNIATEIDTSGPALMKSEPGSGFRFDAFSSREPESTSLESAMNGKWLLAEPFSLVAFDVARKGAAEGQL